MHVSSGKELTAARVHISWIGSNDAVSWKQDKTEKDFGRFICGAAATLHVYVTD